MTKYADLHIHTYYSDSTFSPEEVISHAKAKELSAIAICDHDSVDGVEPCVKLGEACGIEVLSGIELTIEKPDVEIHILGYLVDQKLEWLKEKLKTIQEYRIKRIHKMVEKLSAQNVFITAEDVFKVAGKGSVGRLHLARAMINSGGVKTFWDAFDKYIGFGKPSYVPNIRFTPQDAIGMVLDAGGVPVLAHPGIMKRDDYIPELVSYGLKGIEVYHTDHGDIKRKRYEELAASLGLLMTGGSDCHGTGKGRALIGTVKVPYELVEKLKAAAGSGKNNQ